MTIKRWDHSLCGGGKVLDRNRKRISLIDSMIKDAVIKSSNLPYAWKSLWLWSLPLVMGPDSHLETQTKLESCKYSMFELEFFRTQGSWESEGLGLYNSKDRVLWGMAGPPAYIFLCLQKGQNFGPHCRSANSEFFGLGVGICIFFFFTRFEEMLVCLKLWGLLPWARAMLYLTDLQSIKLVNKKIFFLNHFSVGIILFYICFYCIQKNNLKLLINF